MDKPTKILVAYYSQTGYTKRLAEFIATRINADLLELRPRTPYTEQDMDWTNSSSRVVDEHNNVANVSVELEQTRVDGFDTYTTVFIGYPIWWNEASWVVDNFIRDNDFTGKDIVTFGTSNSTGSGESGKRLERLGSTGRWLSSERFPSNFNRASVESWLERLGF